MRFGNADIRVIASDIGGTLAGASGRISERTAAAVRSAVSSGIPFVLVSGYNLNIVNDHLQRIWPGGHPGLWAIVQNGAMIMVNGKVLETNFLPLDPAHRAVRFFIEHGLSPIAFFGPDLGGCLYAQPALRGVDPLPGRKVEIVDDLSGCLRSEPVQISTYAPTARIREIENEAHAMFGDDCYVVLSIGSEMSWLEINHSKANKLTAFIGVLDRLGVSPKQALYFGDNLNDVDVLQTVAYPVVMENGLPEVKTMAWRVAPHHDQDGVARVLEELLGLTPDLDFAHHA